MRYTVVCLYYLYNLFYLQHASYSWHITYIMYCSRCLHLMAYWNGFQNAESIVSGTELCNYFPNVSLEATVSSDVDSIPFCIGFCFSLVLCSVCLCVFKCVCTVHLSGLPIVHLPTRCPLSVAPYTCCSSPPSALVLWTPVSTAGSTYLITSCE